MNEIKIQAMLTELHNTINMQLQRLINMAAENAELKEAIKAKEIEIASLKNGNVE